MNMQRVRQFQFIDGRRESRQNLTGSDIEVIDLVIKARNIAQTATLPDFDTAGGSRLTELLKQPQYQPMPMSEEVVVIYAGVNGYLDTLKVSDVGRFEQGLLGEVRANGKDILDSIQSTGQLDADTEKKLKGLLDKFLERFS